MSPPFATRFYHNSGIGGASVQDLIDLLYRLESGALSETSKERGFREKLRQVIDNTRRLWAELRPSALDDLDLP